MKAGSLYEVHVFRRAGPNYERTVLLTNFRWKQWDITKKLVCGKRNMAVFYLKVLLRENLWKMVTTKYHFVNVRRHGHPLVLVEGGYILHVVKLDEIVEELRRQEGPTCLCFSFAGFALLAVDSRVTGSDMLTVSKISVVNSSLQTKICRCGDLYESLLLI
ncbi:hypothetical protein ACFX13_037535 [Malus domestica]